MIKRIDQLLRGGVLISAVLQFVTLSLLLSPLESAKLGSDSATVYFLPNVYTYVIWFVLLLCGLVYSIVQALLTTHYDKRLTRLASYYMILFGGFSIWLYLTIFTGQYFSPEFKPNYLFGSIVILSLMGYAAFKIYFKLDSLLEKQDQTKGPKFRKESVAFYFDLFRQTTAGLYCGWLLATSLGVISSYLFSMSFSHVFSTIQWGFFVIIVLSLVSIFVLKKTQSPTLRIAFSGSVLWALIGIIVQNNGHFVIIVLAAATSCVGLLLSIAYSIFTLHSKKSKKSIQK